MGVQMGHEVELHVSQLLHAQVLPYLLVVDPVLSSNPAEDQGLKP